MNWRQFKEQPEGVKGLKGFKGGEVEGLKPLRPLKPAEVEIKRNPPANEEELLDMVRVAYAELDALRDWTGWRKSLTEEQRRRIVAIETRIDATYAALDRKTLTMTLSDYKAAHVTVTANTANF